MMKLQLVRSTKNPHTISPQIRHTQIPPTAKKKEHLPSTKCLGRLSAISRYIQADVQRDLHSERPYVYQRTLRNPLDDNSSCEWIAFTTRRSCHGDDRCVSFHLCAHTGCGHYASYDLEEPSRAEQTGAIPRPTIPKHLPPPIHSTARHDARLEEETRHGNVSLTNSAPEFYDSSVIVLLVFFLSRIWCVQIYHRLPLWINFKS